jgi:N-acetylglucosamine kinase-like BadF-type ATPase
MHFKQPQIIYTNRWRNLQCSGGGDEMGREETRRDGQRREGRDEREGVGDKMKWELGNLNLKDLRWFIYIVKTASFWAFSNA